MPSSRKRNWRSSESRKRLNQLYKSFSKKLSNKIRKLKKHVSKYPSDKQAKTSLKSHL